MQSRVTDLIKNSSPLRIRRALLSVSDKRGLVELGKALSEVGAELVATGRTARVLEEAGLRVVSIENVTGNPEAFQGRMKTLSFQVCSGILYRRGDASDEAELKKLKIPPIDCVVVNFYPFEEARAARTGEGLDARALIDEIDIGGPTLVRAAAKNVPDVLVLTDPSQYADVIAELKRDGAVSSPTALACARRAWSRVVEYDQAIASEFGEWTALRYGENPHQRARLEVEGAPENSPIAWPRSTSDALTPNELSYNNILDLSNAHGLAAELVALKPDSVGVVIVKHNNPCGVALVPKSASSAQKIALLRAWEGDPVSAFGGVICFTSPLEEETAEWLADRFVEAIAAPGLLRESPALKTLLAKRKKLKAVAVRRFEGGGPRELRVSVEGGVLVQTPDVGLGELLRSVTKKPWDEGKTPLARFGIAICRALKSNALAIVREVPAGPPGSKEGAFQLVGAGQGQPNRVEALKQLAIPRAQAVLRETGGRLEDCVLVSDAFFPFRDTVDAAQAAGVRWIIQPGGSLKDQESIEACDEAGVAMAMTGVRHFRH